MTQMEIDDLMHQVILSLQIRCSILPRLANFLATVKGAAMTEDSDIGRCLTKFGLDWAEAKAKATVSFTRM